MYNFVKRRIILVGPLVTPLSGRTLTLTPTDPTRVSRPDGGRGVRTGNESFCSVPRTPPPPGLPDLGDGV